MTDTVTKPLAEEMERLRNQVCDIGDAVAALTLRIAALEWQTPQARQAQYEADITAADLAEFGLGGAVVSTPQSRQEYTEAARSAIQAAAIADHDFAGWLAAVLAAAATGSGRLTR